VSWKDFWKWRRIISGFAFPIVILTSCLVAVVAHWLIPGFTLALGFLLGGIVSPPDAMSVTTGVLVKMAHRLAPLAKANGLVAPHKGLIQVFLRARSCKMGHYFAHSAAKRSVAKFSLEYQWYSKSAIAL